MDFPLTDLMDQDACYHKLVGLLHPDRLACPTCKASVDRNPLGGYPGSFHRKGNELRRITEHKCKGYELGS